MKRLSIIISLLVAALCFLSCKKELPEPSIELSKEIVNAGHEGLTEKIRMTCNYDWTLTKDSEWIEVSSNKGNAGTFSIELTVAPSLEMEERKASVTVTCSNKSKVITVVQTPANIIYVLEDKVQLGSRNQEFSIVVVSNITYEVRIPAECSWISKTGRVTESVTKEMFSVTDNDSPDKREAVISFIDTETGTKAEVTVTQLPEQMIFVDKNEVSLDCEGGSFELEILYNTEYSIYLEEGVDWVTFTETKSLESKKYTFIVEENQSRQRRNTYVSIRSADGSKSQIVYIWQKEFTEVINYSGERTFNVGYDKGAIEIELSSNCALVKESSADWITVIDTKKMEDSRYTLAFSQNTSMDSRTATVTFTAETNPDVKLKLEVIQAANLGCPLFFEFTGKECTAPAISGSTAFYATIDWGDGCVEPYSKGLGHSYSNKGSYSIKVTTVNGEKIKFADIVGISLIDPSEL